MSDPCDNCNKPYCYKCEHADSEPCEKHTTKARKDYLIDQIHLATQIVHWLSYQPEMSDSESHQLEKMSAFLDNLRYRIE